MSFAKSGRLPKLNGTMMTAAKPAAKKTAAAAKSPAEKFEPGGGDVKSGAVGPLDDPSAKSVEAKLQEEADAKVDGRSTTKHNDGQHTTAKKESTPEPSPRELDRYPADHAGAAAQVEALKNPDKGVDREEGGAAGSAGPTNFATVGDGEGYPAAAPIGQTGPYSASQTPPEAPEVRGQGKVPVSTLRTDAVADGLRVQEREAFIRDEFDNKVNADDVFTDADATGTRTAKVRLIQHGSATVWERAIRSLLIAQGQQISDAGAEVILAKIRAEK